MSYVSRIVTVLNPDGSHKGSAVYEAEDVNGRVFDLDPRPIAAGDKTALAAAMSQAQAAALVTIDAQAAQIAAHEATIKTLTDARDAALAQVSALQAQLAPAPVLVPVGEFVSRFTGSEFDAVKAMAETDGVVAGFLARIRQPEPINVASPALPAALQYLASKGAIAADRVEALSAR